MGLNLDGVSLDYATAQPLFERDGIWVFMQDADILPELSLGEDGIEKVELATGKGEVKREGHSYILRGLHPGYDCVITVTRKGGSAEKILVLSREEGRQSWKLAEPVISTGPVYSPGSSSVTPPTTCVAGLTAAFSPGHEMSPLIGLAGAFTADSGSSI